MADSWLVRLVTSHSWARVKNLACPCGGDPPKARPMACCTIVCAHTARMKVGCGIIITSDIQAGPPPPVHGIIEQRVSSCYPIERSIANLDDRLLS